MTEHFENHFQQNKVVYLLYLIFVTGIVGFSSLQLYQYNKASYKELSTNVVNLREGPGITYDIKDQLDGNNPYRILRQENNWYYVLLDNNEVGWIPTWLADNQDIDSSDFIATTLIDDIQIYEENSEDATVLTSAEKNSKYQILHQADGWAQIQLSGEIGWVKQTEIDVTPGTIAYEENTEITEEEQSTYDEFLSDYDFTVKATADGVNIRSEANKDSEILVKGTLNEQFAYLGQENEYYHVRSVDGTEGYIVNWLSESDSTAMVDKAQAAEATSTLAGRTIVLDPGHGGIDPGAVTDGLYEKEVTLQTALTVKEKLEAAGVNVILTRDDDSDVALADIPYTANQANADLLISFHYDAIESTGASGTTAYYYGDDSIPVAQEIQAQLMEQLPLESNGVKFGDFQVIRELAGEGVLLELGYMSTPSDVAVFSQEEYWNQVADAIYNALVIYYQ
ncbi:SH3 domain-containing protein [Carnobacterium sp. PL12RED10]|uniref:N-acetylmuramoyl-L-alanine amidase n=1 Tax=Carnobacterium sp. PL12RED10 TaxID=2592351 RepID=UPI0011F09B59|nr:N-acetylmuramoyl-L-alanine amidase [Carnobacterium sp. PL12RED10]KAF3299615.1 SH3 domain-containing protein [Carnobacterium sp. PL12RED10]